MSSDWKQLLRSIEQAGGQVTLRRSNHYRIAGPSGIYFTSGTPGDRRARLNLLAGVRAIGIDVRGQ